MGSIILCICVHTCRCSHNVCIVHCIDLARVAQMKCVQVCGDVVV